MLSEKNFKKLSMEEKQDLLADLFKQIQTDDTNFDDVIFLLQSVSSIGEETLNGIYADIVHLLSLSKDEVFRKRKEYFHKIHQRLEDEAKKDGNDADSLLEEIE